MIAIFPTGESGLPFGAEFKRPQVIMAEALGTVTPDRYGRIVAFATANSLDPGSVLDLATGLRVYPPGHSAGHDGHPTELRRSAELGDAAWSDVLAEIEARAPEVIGRAWDAEAYGAFLAAGNGVSVRWRVVAALRECRAAGIPVVLTVTAPSEFAAGLRAMLGGIGFPLVLTSECGGHKDDGALWAACRREHAPLAAADGMLVIEDAWGSCEAAVRQGATAWWLEGDEDADPLARALSKLAVADA